MAARADTYSRFVATVKVLLPLAALGLLSTLFLFSGEVDPTQSIPYAELNVEQLAREQRVTAPYFAGVTEDGTAVTITGLAAVPDQDRDNRFTIEMLDARFIRPDTSSLEATAPEALVDQRAGTILMSGGAVLRTSDGVRMETDVLFAELDTANMESRSAIVATAPFGRLTAEALEMRSPAPDVAHRIVFQGDVKLVYSDEE